MLKKFYVLFLSLVVLKNSTAQELNCQVQVLTPSIQASDKTIYETLQTAIGEFMNNRKWTQDNFLNQERIDCGLQINISSRVSTDDFDATIQITSVRPVYKSSYRAPVLNLLDRDFTFKYVQDQTLEFDESAVNSNLTAVLAYYANLIIGFDYETFSLEGGSMYLTKAQTIVNNAQNLSDRGWKAFESEQNRYWVVENMLNVAFKPLRSTLYKYHRLGFDLMNDNMPEGRANVLESLKSLKKVNQEKPNSYLMQVFFDAKADEIVSVFSGASLDEKNQAVQTLNLIDPAHTSKYTTIMGSR